MIKRLLAPLLFLFMLSVVLTACETEPDTFEATGDDSYFAPAGSDPIQFQVDSVVYDPSIGGTSRIATTSTWTLEPLVQGIDSQPFTVTVKGSDSSSVAVQRYIWDFQSSALVGGRHTNQLDGFSYVSLVTPFTSQSSWDALLNADPDLEITVAGEPLKIHKDWTSARVDSIGAYMLPTGSSVDAVWVVLTDAENAIELRVFKEVYGKGIGLLERNQRFLDTQQAASTEPWEIKAENGFTVHMKRLF